MTGPTAAVVTAAILGTVIVAVVWIIEHYHRRGGINPTGPGGLGNVVVMPVHGRTGETGTLWEPFIVNGEHDHDDQYSPLDHTHEEHDHDDQYSPLRHTHEEHITRSELSRRLATLRVSQIPQNLFGALAIILATTLLGALIGLLLDLTVLRHWLNHEVLNLVTGKVDVTTKTVTLTPHYHMVTDWLQALGVVTFGSIAGFVIGAIIVLVSWWRRRREVNVVETTN